MLSWRLLYALQKFDFPNFPFRGFPDFPIKTTKIQDSRSRLACKNLRFCLVWAAKEFALSKSLNSPLFSFSFDLKGLCDAIFFCYSSLTSPVSFCYEFWTCERNIKSKMGSHLHSKHRWFLTIVYPLFHTKRNLKTQLMNNRSRQSFLALLLRSCRMQEWCSNCVLTG